MNRRDKIDFADVTIMFATLPLSAYGTIEDREPRLTHAVNRPRALSIACLLASMNVFFPARHFMTGVLIGGTVAALVFVLVQ